jgi:hypothetical protein
MFKLNNKETRLVVLQRIELINSTIKRIRPEYFKNIFESVNLIDIRNQTVHKSTRVACSRFLF